MEKSLREESGQALVIMVFALVALLVVAGLAIDGGAAFLERRRMQNSADASALAGTRLLAEAICGESAATDAAIFAEVKRYAESNGVKDPDSNVQADYVDKDETVLGPVGGGTIPTDATGILADVKIARPTTFLSLIGIDEVAASAAALAMTGPPRMAGGGIRPFGIPLHVVQDLDPDDPDNDWFTISFKHDGGDITWGDDNLAQHRGWMNMGYVWNQGEDPDFPRAIDDSTGASGLKEWMENGWQGVIYIDCLWYGGCRYGDYIHAKPGTNSSAVCKAPEDTLIYIPIYDLVPHCEDEPIPGPKPACPTQGGGYCYHIVGIAGVEITDCSQGQGVIEADLVETIMGEGTPSLRDGMGYGGTRACETHTQVVTLWK